MARKPDYFEQMAEKKNFRLHKDAPWLIKQDDAVTLLRRYHAKVRRMVHGTEIISSDYGRGRFDMRMEILDALDTLKKGKS